jgi:uroporphyrin-III C-methyltransferase/precorrin-2 dehydrogenase/sirohydrochlorin ferrochelatase
MRIVSKRRNKSAARMQALACLPVFFTLTDKRVLVIGGSDAAAWKVELLLAAGSQVEVCCPVGELSSEMLSLMHGSGRLVHVNAHWEDVKFAGAALVVADLGAEEALGLVKLARGHAVPVNVIDKPAFCDFQFGSIVNRSPIVVGISTAGAAPILGQAVRRRIEAVLPMALAGWGKLAGEIRTAVMERFKPGVERRRFWEAFVDRAFGDGAPRADDLLDGEALAYGSITIVGAGPGDPELLTLKAVRALQAADEIFYDEAVGPEILELARREARRECVGFGPSRSLRAQMVALARDGKNVAYVQLGDALAPSFDDVRDVRVVPGISGAAEVGLSLTG